MKKLLAIIVLIFLNLCSDSQEMSFPKNNLFVEFWGNAYFYSLNYERVYGLNPNLLITSRVGVSYYKFFGDNYYSIPLSSSLLFGKKTEKLELGLSYTNRLRTASIYDPLNDITFVQKSHPNIFGPIIGFRYQPNKKAVMIRVVYSPWFLSSKNNDGMRAAHWGGFSVGYSF